MRTLFLDPSTWDLVVDRAGNLAVASEPYALAQDAASEIRTFQGECYFDRGRGVPYWQQILGKLPPAALVRDYITRAAMRVPGVVRARCYFIGFEQRPLRGQVQVTGEAGLPSYAEF